MLIRATPILLGNEVITNLRCAGSGKVQIRTFSGTMGKGIAYEKRTKRSHRKVKIGKKERRVVGGSLMEGRKTVVKIL